MKALQQAAQNRSAKTGGEAAPGDGAGPAARVEPAVSGSAPGTPASADIRQEATELNLEPLPVPPVEPAEGAGPDAIAPPARMMASPREPAPPPVRERQAASAAVAPAAARSDRRAAPRWSGDLQTEEMPADRPTIDGEPAWRRSQLRAEASPARASAVLAAGAGAARAGALSRLSRLHWILIIGGGAVLVLFTYFYIQINHSGLFQRGFRSPPAATPLVSRPAPAPAAAAGPGQIAGITAPVALAPAATGTVQAVLATPDPASAGTAGLPASLAASPLLNPPPAAPAPIAGSAVPAPAALPPNTRPIPSAPPEPGRTVPSSQAPAIASEGSGATAPGTSAAARAGNAAAGRTAAVGQAATPGPAPAGDSIRVTRGSSSAPVNPALADAWDHLQAGRLEAAQRLYSQVATAEPRNIDALLGLAAVAQLGNQAEAANRLWLRVLDIEPRNAHAQAALLGQIGRADPAAAESQLKSLIGREPSPFLYFTLGNLYADQNRWAQAQQAYFQAHHLQPGNADYAFNLAVGLERLGQPRLAATYLRTAIRLADAGSRPNFDVEAARRRAKLLEANGAP